MAAVRVLSPATLPQRVSSFLREPTLEGLEEALGVTQANRLTAYLSNKSVEVLPAEDPYPLRTIEIETVNRCNSDCSFCPVNRHDDIRPLKRMSDALYQKILDELSVMGYAGELALFSNNEPLVDKGMVSKVQLARQACPRATIVLLTNGILLTTDLARRLLEAGLSSLVIDNYADDLALMPNIARVVHDLAQAGCDHMADRVTVRVLRKNAVRTNRAGTAPNKSAATHQTFRLYAGAACMQPFVQMVIRPDGQVSRCCQDAYGQVTMGDLSISSIAEVWSSPAYQRVRSELRSSGRRHLPVCSGCDVPFVDRSLLSRWVKRKLRRS